MIKPTVGRVVLFRTVGHESNQPEAATVAYVHSDSQVNLVVHDHNGVSRGEKNVWLRQAGDSVPVWAKHWAEWMPYQVGQAAKVEQLEQQLKDGHTSERI